uniref:hypothetical protein n=1 Tax=Candidatus Electronema sp. TaxID=2698783 RepID=UPI004055A5EB
MLHYFALPEAQQSRKNSGTRFLSVAAASLLLSVLLLTDAAAQEAPAPAVQTQQAAGGAAPPAAVETNSISKVSAQRAGKRLEIEIHCAKMPEYTDRELPGSGRRGIVVDIANAEIASTADLTLPEEFKITLSTSAKTDTQPPRMRFEFSLAEPYVSYAASLNGHNIVLILEDFFKDEALPLPEAAAFPAPTKEKAKEAEKEKAKGPDKDGEKKSASGESIDAHLPQVQVPLKSGSAAKAENPFGGIDDAPLITVDFYKVDLHNVFRLLGEVSGINIVVAEGVSGTLTLALNEVPWDFALDIILNLKDLAKEKRHNTIVIFPKDKEFVWPKRAAELIIEDETAGKTQGGMITIRPDGDQQQPEAIEAKQIVAKGLKAEKEGGLETAVQLYEKALNIWPDKVERQEKSKLANKIASIYLTRLNQNAKAVYYAKKALAADKKNSSAALNAAIGHANMEEHSQAQRYFDQSISIGTPSRDALFNYAVFSERQRQYDAALRLLDKYSELYGENLDSMVSRARIFDLQGRKDEADKVYTAILHAGFSVPSDLRTFILNRTR